MCHEGRETLHNQRKGCIFVYQAADRMIGAENIPPELPVEQVIGDEWIYPNDPRLAQMDN